MVNTQYIKAPNLSVQVGEETYAYRELGKREGIPVVFFVHLAGTLDNWDPRVIDGIAKKRWVITFDNLGIGLSSGKVPESIHQMAADALHFVHALGIDKMDVLSFSMGGMIAQELMTIEPNIVNRLILAGTGPRGGSGIENVTKLSDRDTVRALLTLKDVKTYLFFTRTKNGKQKAKEFLLRLKERQEDRDKSISLKAYRIQLKAITKWGLAESADLSTINVPTLIVNGDDDRMVPTINSYNLNKRISGSQIIIYNDAGHGGIFQNHEVFVKTALEFLL
ncbi:Hydrolase, alpha/beta fold family [Leuconostoc inhae]|uniref:Hydrolase, alpha/beta fold family n=2 Tax=Leuconostoc TaxID=1243 RepID=A0AAN2UHJ4_9LACO|nr:MULTISPECIES: alpha/beta hydrolase [Leuconostoc]MBZ5957915.1 alpha/beta hydrolase [Leuconostoc gasicomitatum]MBZ5982118.1 alpha/beta hydrolase [Leuconostoc gasicomitatum]MBZ5987384.1 alpha/beta hydrolase [Leuconostoc gasicomitatum]MBZ5989459.1 alpha/beta hydrolase [Leuconostoc gasicomitatum]MBZ6013866.1 alpha/beta hydrolase [Leuconostoc gelidum subsp. gelidum]